MGNNDKKQKTNKTSYKPGIRLRSKSAVFQKKYKKIIITVKKNIPCKIDHLCKSFHAKITTRAKAILRKNVFVQN